MTCDKESISINGLVIWSYSIHQLGQSFDLSPISEVDYKYTYTILSKLSTKLMSFTVTSFYFIFHLGFSDVLGVELFLLPCSDDFNIHISSYWHFFLHGNKLIILYLLLGLNKLLRSSEKSVQVNFWMNDWRSNITFV